MSNPNYSKLNFELKKTAWASLLSDKCSDFLDFSLPTYKLLFYKKTEEYLVEVLNSLELLIFLFSQSRLIEKYFP